MPTHPRVCATSQATLVGLVLGTLFVLIVSVVKAFKSAPYLMSNCIACLFLSLMFLATENSKVFRWHRYRESENRFWCIVAMLFSSGIVFASDSPLAIGRSHPNAGILIVLGFVFYINYWERSLARKELAGTKTLMESRDRFPSAHFSDELVDGARKKLKEVRDHLRALDYTFVVSKTWNQSDILRRERRVVSILQEASRDELNYIATNVNLPFLFYKIKDSDILTPARYLSSTTRRKNASPSPARGGTATRDRSSSGPQILIDDVERFAGAPPVGPGETTPVSPDVSAAVTPAATPVLGPRAPGLMPPELGVKGAPGGDEKLVESKKQGDENDSYWNLCGSDPANDEDEDAVDGGTDEKYYVRNRTKLLTLFADERLYELKVEARASVINALQHMPLSAHRRGQDLVANIILNTYGHNLQKLKALIDTGGDIHNMHKLVFTDIRRKRIRDNILAHIEQEGLQLLRYRQEMKDSTLPFPNSLMRRPSLRKVLSDVDDTLFSSGGRFPAGMDTKFSHHTLYPGVLAFYKELDLGLFDASHGEWPADWKGNLAFVSARPHVYKDWSQAKSYKLFDRLKANEGLHTSPTLLAGELFSSFQMFRGDFLPMANQKFKNFCEYSKLYPEYSFVFIGDNGQGDVQAAEMMIKHAKGRVEAVFIHKVQKLHLTPGYEDGSREKWERMGIVFFKTYIGACLEACKRGLVSTRGLQAVARAAVRDFPRLCKDNSEQRFARLQELNRDVELCNDFLDSRDCKQVPYVHARFLFARGSLVSTPFGQGRVLDFRHHDGVYEVGLSGWGAHVFILGRKISWAFRGAPGDRVWTPYGTGVLREARKIDGVHIVAIGGGEQNATASKPRMLAFLQPKHIVIIEAAVGDVVTTAFGKGRVIAYRKRDDMYKVEISWGRRRRHRRRRRRGSTKGTPEPGPIRPTSVAYLVASQIHRVDTSSGNSSCVVS